MFANLISLYFGKEDRRISLGIKSAEALIIYFCQIGDPC